MTHVVASAWSRDGSKCYLRTIEFQGHDRGDAEFIYVGYPHGSRVYFHSVMAMRPTCDCGMCRIMDQLLDEEYPVRPRWEDEDGFDEEDFG